jgi:hypothetical protein
MSLISVQRFSKYHIWTDMVKLLGAFLQGLVAKAPAIVLRLVHTF